MGSTVARGLLLAALLCAALRAGPVLAMPGDAPLAPAPAGVALDGDGNIYVTDYALDRVVKLAPDGSVLAQWGGSGNAVGQFSAPFGVAVDGAAIYIVDQLNGRIQKFSTDGSPLATWGAAGAGSGELRTPFGVAVAGGRVYVADFGNDRVQVFGTDGGVVGAIGSRGSGDGQFSRPAGVAVDHDGGLYITDHFNDRVQKFSSDGRFQALLGVVSTVAAASGPVGTAPASPAGPAAAAPAPTAGQTFSAPVATVGTPPAVPTALPLPDAELRRPEGIAVDRDGDLWIADYGRDRVVKLAPDGRLLLSVGIAGTAPGEFVGPKGIAIDPNTGRIYVADTGNARIQRLAPDGTPEATFPLPMPAGATPATTPAVPTTPTPIAAPAFQPIATPTPSAPILTQL